MRRWINKKFLAPPFYKKVGRRRHFILFSLIILMIFVDLYDQNSDYTQWWIFNHGDYANTKELLADKKGAIYASMAGYNIDTLVGKKDNCLLYWARQTGISSSTDDSRYPAMEDRAQFVRSKTKPAFWGKALLGKILESKHNSQGQFL